MINGIRPKALICSKCSGDIPTERLSMGYTICIDCSTEEKKVGHIVYPHKTGAYIQVMDKDTHDNINRLDRRGYKSRTVKHHKPFTITNKPQESKVPYREGSDNIIHTSYNTALKQVLEYYDEWGYKPTLEYLRKLNSSGTIPLMTRVKIQDIITDRYLEPSPRALSRKFNK